MPIKIFNTLGRDVQAFSPIHEGKVNIYHCGPTVYWDQHIGNMRAAVIADLVKRIFKYNTYTDRNGIVKNYNVTLVRNYTDVGHLTGDNVGDADTGEDRMDKAANREGLTANAIADKYIANFERDIKLLNADSADEKPRATEYIDEMKNMISDLYSKGPEGSNEKFAYKTSKGIYFDISKYPSYTKLSGQKLDLQNTHSGHGDVHDSGKRNSADFALWIYAIGAHANALQTWEGPNLDVIHHTSTKEEDAPRGFPGWHLECSVMSKHFLDAHFDVHMGGIEHIPVHHTNEIAQSECANGEKYVNYWLHNEHLLIDGNKMSKSEGTAFTINDIINKNINPLTLRYFFLQAHYRSKQNFTWEALLASQTAYNKLKKQIENLKLLSSLKLNKISTTQNNKVIINLYEEKFLKAINNDFNTSQALAIIWILLKDKDIYSDEKLNLIYKFDQVLGVL